MRRRCTPRSPAGTASSRKRMAKKRLPSGAARARHARWSTTCLKRAKRFRSAIWEFSRARGSAAIPCPLSHSPGVRSRITFCCDCSASPGGSRLREQEAKVFPHYGSPLATHVGTCRGAGAETARSGRRRYQRERKYWVQVCTRALDPPGASRCRISTPSCFKSCAARSTRS
jgi:hypothetical protein